MKKFVVILVMIMAVAVSFETLGQTQRRRINPVKNEATRTQARNEIVKRDSLDKSSLVHMHDANGNVIYIDTVTGKEVVDSTLIPVVPKMEFPLFHSATIGVDLWSPVMRAFGTTYGLVGFSAQLNLHNRYIPTVEVGLGSADYHPEDNNYVYKSPMSIYFKLGADYNVFFNSNPDYMLFAGVRYGFTPFKWQITDVELPENYWQENRPIDFPSQSSFTGYFELLGGVKVKIYRNISMGWTVRYHQILHQSNKRYGEPWYIPGYGGRGSSIAATFSIFYSLPLDKYNKKRPQALSPKAADIIPEPKE
ncbi:MAG: hypothetical protein K2G74_09585 [Muribaculaceae bacterium]|nr:hypothetical protein [Muribaculaceae bacterium]